MNRITILATAVAVLCLVGSAGAQNDYGWTISNSATDALANTGAPGSGGVGSFYLWYFCNSADGMAAAEFDLQAVGITPLAFTPANGFLNAGGVTNLLLAVGGCPSGPVNAGSWLALDLPGSLCLVPSAANAFNVTVDCSANPSAWDNDVRGYSSVGAPCGVLPDGLCGEDPVSVEDESWGSIKGLYR